jgi:hypothetical protein
MDAFRIFLVAGALVVVVIVVVMYVRDRRRRVASLPARDDLRRAGESEGTDSGTAGQRATGSTSWMRPGGGGL